MMSIDQALDLASSIKCEVLNIRADPGMVFERPEYYKLVLDTIQETASRLERHVVPGTHHLHLNDPKSVSGLIVKFLRTSNDLPV